MDDYSPYAIAESEPPKWKPGEDLAAAAFLGMAFLLVVDINVGIWRIFKKRQGLYYWSMTLGTIACLVDAIGVILKYMVPNSGHVWGLHTALLLCGWSVYAPAQLLVLYSRLHLVNDSRRTQRWVYMMVISTIFWLIIPTWVVVWPAYNPDPKISSVWSPRDAIVERYNQVGFTTVECVLSGIYIWSLLRLLNLKASVRQRRVMLDLIYVNIIILSFDLLVMILIYLNRVGISHPIQSFSYALKLKLEFVVLNQLMAVAARGIKRESFEERRYHHDSVADAFSAECGEWEKRPSNTQPGNDNRRQHDRSGESSPTDPIQITVPSPTRSRRGRRHGDSGAGDENARSNPCRLASRSPIRVSETISSNVEEPQSDDFFEDDGFPTIVETDRIRHKPSEAFSGETLHNPESRLKVESPHLYPCPVRDVKDHAMRPLPNPFGQRRQREKLQKPENRRKPAYTGIIRGHAPGNGRDSQEDDEEEEIGVHMWENDRGKMVLEVPWFRSKVENA